MTLLHKVDLSWGGVGVRSGQLGAYTSLRNSKMSLVFPGWDRTSFQFFSCRISISSLHTQNSLCPAMITSGVKMLFRPTHAVINRCQLHLSPNSEERIIAITPFNWEFLMKLRQSHYLNSWRSLGLHFPSGNREKCITKSECTSRVMSSYWKWIKDESHESPFFLMFEDCVMLSWGRFICKRQERHTDFHMATCCMPIWKN